MLFETYYSLLFYTAKDILCDAETAEEIVQDSFVKIWEYRSKLPEIKSLKAYLTGMVRNRCFDYLKSPKNLFNNQSISIDDLTVRMQLLNIESDLAIREELYSDPMELILLRAIDQLPPQCKQIFILNRFEEYTHQQIADELHLSVSTVKTQITRALHKLKSAMTNC